MMMRKYVKQGVCLLLILLTVGFIFHNSAQPVKASNEQSAKVAETIGGKPKEEYEKPADWRAFVSHVRKAAHAVEFFAQKSALPQAVWNVLSCALAVAVADESIQILSGRGPKVQDVLLDFCGAAAATAVALLIFGAVRLYKARKAAANTVS